MKKSLILIGLIFGVLISSYSSFAVRNINTVDAVPPEISEILFAPEFGELLAKQRTLANQTGKSLRIIAFQIVDFGTSKYGYVDLATKTSADIQGQWEPAGSIVGKILSGPMGDIVLDGVYYQPPAALPGGASVGNN